MSIIRNILFQLMVSHLKEPLKGFGDSAEALRTEFSFCLSILVAFQISYKTLDILLYIIYVCVCALPIMNFE